MTRQTTQPIEHTNFSPTNQRATSLARNVASGDLDLQPPYQRGSVWSGDQQIDLVQSWLTGVPTGTVILADRTNLKWRAPDGTSPLSGEGAMWACVDGQQRITTAIRFFSSEFAVPASWFDPAHIMAVEDTPDGPYVRHGGLTLVGQRMIDSRASIQVGEARTCTGIPDEARIYLLVNSGGTSQTTDDLDNARRVAAGS